MKHGLSRFLIAGLCSFALASCGTYDGQDKAAREELVEGKLSSLSIEKMPDKVVYDEGEYFDDAGLQIKAHFSSNKSYIVSRDAYTYPYEKLSKDVSSVRVSYRTAYVDVPITVKEFAPANSYIYEAEGDDIRLGDACGTSGARISNVEEGGNASGSYLGGLNGRVFNITVKVDASEAKKAGVYLALGLDADIALEEEYEMFVNGVAVEINEGTIVGEGATSFQEVMLGKIDLIKGANTIVVSHMHRGGKPGNVDYLKLASDASLSLLDDLEESKVECFPTENPNATYTTTQSDYRDETGNSPSGGHACGGCGDGENTSLTVVVNASAAGKYAWYMRQGLQPANYYTSSYTVKINDATISTSGAYADKTTGSNYTDWCDIYWGEIELQEGENTISVVKTSGHTGCNMDYFAFYGAGSIE